MSTATQRFTPPTDEQIDNRFMHHAPKGDRVDRYAQVRKQIAETAKRCVAITPCCPEQSRALNALDEAMFLFNAAIARHE